MSVDVNCSQDLSQSPRCPALQLPPEVGLLLYLMNIERKSFCLLSFSFLRSFERMELVRLRPLLLGQQAGDHCVCAGLTMSTSFPRAVGEGISGEQEKGGANVGRKRVAMKEDCSNKISG